MIRIIGIDCATQEANIGIVSADYDENECCVAEFESRRTVAVDRIAELLDNTENALLCLDAPLGWPISLAKSLVNHEAGAPLNHSANKMFRRVTDEVIRKMYNKQPLDVGADRIARTAHSALNLLQSLRERLTRHIELAWDYNIKQGIWAIEVYPAATAIAHGLKLKGYKNKTTISEVIAGLLPHVARKLQLPIDQTLLSTSDHNFDALLCVLAGVDFLSGVAMPPEEIQKTEALKEGWIWVKRKDST